jgi:hypothetical protein
VGHFTDDGEAEGPFCANLEKKALPCETENDFQPAFIQQFALMLQIAAIFL